MICGPQNINRVSGGYPLQSLKQNNFTILTFEAEIEKADGTCYDNESIVTDKKKIIVLLRAK
jgi:hypothetical protein